MGPQHSPWLSEDMTRPCAWHSCSCLLSRQVQESARRTYGAVLERAARADRIRSVSSLLKRFSHLFGMPARVKALAREGDLEQVVR